MADETKIEQTQVKATETVAAIKAPAEAAVKTVEKAVDQAAKTADKAVAAATTAARKPRATAKRRTAKAVSARATAAAKPIKRRAAKATKRTIKPAIAAAIPTERTPTMTYDFNQMFAAFPLPGADRFQALFANTGERTQEWAAKSQKATEELTELAKGNVEAIVEASKIAVAGVRTIGQDALASGREGLDLVSQNARTLNEATSPAEFLQIQSELAKSAFDRLVAENSKLVERMVKLAGEAAQPLQNRASVNAERVNELMA